MNMAAITKAVTPNTSTIKFSRKSGGEYIIREVTLHRVWDYASDTLAIWATAKDRSGSNHSSRVLRLCATELSDARNMEDMILDGFFTLADEVHELIIVFDAMEG